MSHHHCHAPHPPGNNAIRRALYIALLLNLSLFAVEIWQGLAGNSTALLADAMDFLSDSLSYVITLFVLSMPLAVRAKASLLKATLMLLLGAFALAQGAWHAISSTMPDHLTMGWVSVLALMANITSAYLLYRTRERDSNMRSVWLCSRNDAISNVLVMIAAACVFATGTLWPDLIAAIIIATIAGRSALQIIKDAKAELNA